MARLSRLSLHIFALALVALVGCQTAEDADTVPVSGTVSYQGNPIVEGQIAFIPDTSQLGAGMAYSFPIVDGKFEGRVSPGQKTVRFYSSWETGRQMAMDDGSGMVPVRASLPAKYNEKSQIQVELKPEPNEGLEFDLE